MSTQRHRFSPYAHAFGRPILISQANEPINARSFAAKL